MANPSPPQTGRGLGIKFNDMLLAGQGISHCAPGPTNSILDVDAGCVGHANYLSGNYYVNNVLTPTTVVPPADVNSGVTAILPLGNTKPTARGRRPKSGSGYQYNTYVPAGFFSVNGCGEMTGIHWVEEYGLLQGPIMLCNTVNVGTVRSAVIKYWYDAQNPNKLDLDDAPLLPVVAETDDSWLNNSMNPFLTASPTVTPLDFGPVASAAITGALSAADTATTPLQQGNCGGGTGMTCYSWKGGIGTSSRVVQLGVSVPSSSNPNKDTNTFTVGVLVQANQGAWNELTILGAPVGPLLRFAPNCCSDTEKNCGCVPDTICECGLKSSASSRKKVHRGVPRSAAPPARAGKKGKSSIIVVIATDAPLMPHQLKRLARRGAHGIARTGTSSHDDSGELCIAFSTGNQDGFNGYQQTGNIARDMCFLPDDKISPCLFTAVVEATEEAIINALVAAQDLAYVTPSGDTQKACAIAGPKTWPTLQGYLQAYKRA